jgi:OOP family OmpA-OmpF porin
MKKLIVVLISGLAAMGMAQAQTTSKAYVGAAVSASDTNYRIGGATDVKAGGYKGAGKIFGGYEFDQTWGVEAGYTDLRSTDGTYRIGNTAGRVNSDGSRTYVAAKASLPMNQQVSVYGKLGVGYSKTDVSMSTPSVSFDDSDTEAYGAVGAQYSLNQNVALIAEYERYGKKKDFGPKADTWTIGARYAF